MPYKILVYTSLKRSRLRSNSHHYQPTSRPCGPTPRILPAPFTAFTQRPQHPQLGCNQPYKTKPYPVHPRTPLQLVQAFPSLSACEDSSSLANLLPSLFAWSLARKARGGQPGASKLAVCSWVRGLKVWVFLLTITPCELGLSGVKMWGVWSWGSRFGEAQG